MMQRLIGFALFLGCNGPGAYVIILRCAEGSECERREDCAADELCTVDCECRSARDASGDALDAGRAPKRTEPDASAPVVREETPEQCQNGLDDDRDGRIDCEERRCARFTICGGTKSETGPE